MFLEANNIESQVIKATFADSQVSEHIVKQNAALCYQCVASEESAINSRQKFVMYIELFHESICAFNMNIYFKWQRSYSILLL